MDIPQSRTRIAYRRCSVRNGQLARILWILAASGGSAGSWMSLQEDRGLGAATRASRSSALVDSLDGGVGLEEGGQENG